MRALHVRCVGDRGSGRGAEFGARLMCVVWRSAPLEPPIDNARVRPTACIAATGCPNGSDATAALTASCLLYTSPSPRDS